MASNISGPKVPVAPQPQGANAKTPAAPAPAALAAAPPPPKSTAYVPQDPAAKDAKPAPPDGKAADGKGRGKEPEGHATTLDSAVNADAFRTDVRSQPELAAAALAGQPLTTLANKLSSNLQTVIDALKLPAQMQLDLSVQMAALMGPAGSPREAKATRLMEFLVPYAERLATLEKGSPLTAQEKKQVIEQLLKTMANVGLAKVIELTTQRSGMQVAHALLNADAPEDVRKAMEGLKFDSTEAPHAAPANAREPAAVSSQQLNGQPQIQATLARARAEEVKAEEAKKRRSKGGSMWGALHQGRSDKGHHDDDQRWLPDDKALYAAAVVALIIAMTVAALLTVFR